MAPIVLMLVYLICFVFAVFAIFIFIFYDWRSLEYRKKCRALPAPKQNIIFGIALDIARLPHKDLLEWMQGLWMKVGDIVYFEVLGLPAVILMNPVDIEAVLSNSQHINKGLEYTSLQPWLCEGLLTSSGSKWHIHRKLLTPTFHFKILENFLPIMNKNAALLTKKLAKESAQCQYVDVDAFASTCTLDIICETAMGVSLNSQLGEAADYVSALRRAGELILLRTMTFWMRNDFLFGICSAGREFRCIVKKLHEFTEKVIKERKELFKAKQCTNNNQDFNIGVSKVRKSFLDCLLEVQEELPQVMTDQAIREEVDTFMFEGQDTTAAALTWTFFMIAIHPEIQKNIKIELDNIFDSSTKEATLSDLNQMQYLEKVIKETLRLFPSVPYISRTLTTDLHLVSKQLTVPAGTNISVIPYLVHRNPAVFEDALKFDPERFSPKNSKLRHPYSYIPFSAGFRNCIGQKFAMMEAKIVLSTVIRNLEVNTKLKRDDVVPLPNTILRPSRQILLSFNSR